MKKYFIFMLISLYILSCNENVGTSMTEHYSTDSLFSIEVPSSYTIYNNTLPSYIAFINDDDVGIITIKREKNQINSSDFEEFANNGIKTVKGNINLINKNDSIIHYKVSKGLFVVNIYYLWKLASTNDYLIQASGMNLKYDAAVMILLSVKEHSTISEYITKSSDKNFIYYKDAGFAINKDYKLQENFTYIEMYERLKEKHNLPKLIASYVCPINLETEDPLQIDIINIAVNSHDENAENRTVMDNYKKTLMEQNIDYKDVIWNDIPCIEYSFYQDMEGTQLPTKALYVHNGDKFFLFQIASLSNIEDKFELLVKSIFLL